LIAWDLMTDSAIEKLQEDLRTAKSDPRYRLPS
jgi:hypothetical protein